MKGILAVAFGTGTLLDFFVSMVGLAIILQADTILTYLICIAMSFTLVCLRLCFEIVWSRQGMIYSSLKCAFCIALVVDFISSSTALISHVLLKRQMWAASNVQWSQDVLNHDAVLVKMILLLIAIYLAASPIVISHLAQEYAEENEDEEIDEVVPTTQRKPPFLSGRSAD